MLRLALALSAVLATPAVAQAEDLMQSFRSICLGSGAEPEVVRSLAASQGFVAPPPAFQQRFSTAAFPNAEVLWKTDAAGMWMVFFGSGPVPGQSRMEADLCAVGSSPRSSNNQSRLQSELDVGPPQQGRTPMFVFEERNGARTRLTQQDGAAVVRALGTRTLRFAMSRDDPAKDISMLMLMAPY